ncbi:MAG: hypothetical protein LBR57_04025 [Alistipes sp.]|jgi:flagellar basal body-associated protein FliL|nr:hypothetical protein [Alistipes sp.]
MAKQKTKQTKEAGYVPFTRDDINTGDGRNSRAEELFLQMLDIPKRVVKKKKKGKETDIVDDDFYPTSADELARMQDKMAQVEAAIDDPRDTGFMENVGYMKGVLAWSGKRQWNFAWWIIICVAIVACYFFWHVNDKNKDLQVTKAWSEQVVQEKYNAQLERDQTNVSNAEKRLAEAATEADKKSAAEGLEWVAEQRDKTLEQGTEGFHKEQIRWDRRQVNKNLISALWCLLWIGLYIVAERPYGYMLSKRRTEMKIYGGLRKALFWVAGLFVGMAGALQVTETVTKWSDGTTTRDNDAMMIMALKILLLLAAVLLVLVTARIVIVIATIMGFIRNYDLIAITKRTFSKAQELTAKKEAA